MSQPVRSPRLHYGWIAAGLTFVTLLVAAGIRSAPGVMMVPVEAEFGWSRATISFAVSVNLVLYGLMAPFAAAVMDRIGVRRTMALALAVLALGVAATTLMRTPWHMVLLWGIVVGGGSGTIALVLGATVVTRWFDAHRGTVMGLLSAATATGQLIFLPQMAMLVEHWGWREAVLLIAAAAAVFTPVIWLFMRDRPADLGLWPVGATEAPPPVVRAGNPAVAAVMALKDGMKSRDFWLLAGTFFVCGLSTNGLIGTHLISACFDHGIPEVKAAGLLAAMGIFDILGTTASGWLSDRWDSRKLLFWYYGLRGLSLIFLDLAFGPDVFGLWLFAVFYGLDWIATVPPTVKLTTQAFGREKAGVMFGWIFAAHQLGAATAAFAAGVIRTDLGDYWLAFVLSGLACLVAAAMSLMIGRKVGPRPVAEGAAA
ncbi:putative monocarboxylate permease, transmembrane transport protein of the MFS family [Magnetospirillum sp. XM-1]|uniref:MFS transporter n=1 Tax=Magnetospirillum sp. XM-1 TaxID=1663591 RepID=UPI00073DFA6C|nr:MFS transporter [Magnetospirillum sp. XM-1]CUW39844.1 putative monocarboxylate permease, transmembrane transport protein of the MFS family [Magnetospirillum sp. XM-1]